jgi:hypothetical protein
MNRQEPAASSKIQSNMQAIRRAVRRSLCSIRWDSARCVAGNEAQIAFGPTCTTCDSSASPRRYPSVPESLGAKDGGEARRSASIKVPGTRLTQAQIGQKVFAFRNAAGDHQAADTYVPATWNKRA